MPKKPDWTFPDLPPFLAGLTLDALSRLRALIRRHGRLIGVSALGEVHALILREPIAVGLIVTGASDAAELIVAPMADLKADDNATIALVPGGETAVVWSPRIALADILSCLDPDAVVLQTSQLAKAKKDGFS